MPHGTRNGWAPWYHYVSVMAVANAVTQWLIGGVDPVTNAVVSVVLNAVLLVAVTAVHRARHGVDR